MAVSFLERQGSGHALGGIHTTDNGASASNAAVSPLPHAHSHSSVHSHHSRNTPSPTPQSPVKNTGAQVPATKKQKLQQKLQMQILTKK